MNDNIPTILGFVENLMFTSRIESVVENLGFRIHWMTGFNGDESLELENLLIDRINHLNPGLILIDLEMGKIPWENWIKRVKSDPSTKPIHILCFGSHKDVGTIKKARQAGADKVVARSKFFSTMPDLIRGFNL